MPSPVPSFFKNLIAGATSGLCEKFNKMAVGLSQGFADWVAFEYNEDGQSLTDEFIALLCAANCGPGSGGGGGNGEDNPNMPRPQNVVASDGTYSSKVRITWSEVTPPSGSVSNYYIYRAPIGTTNALSSVQIGTVSGSTFSFDDTTAAAGVQYNYWVRATNGTDTSSYGGPDSGYASAATVTWGQTTDLVATKGYDLTTGYIRLVFSVPVGTTAFDVYRNTSNDSGTATLIAENVTFRDVTAFQPTIADGLASQTGVNTSTGGPKLVYFHTPPDMATKYFFWIKSKTDSPPQISDFSNSDSGWVILGSQDAGASPPASITVGAFTIPGGVSKMRVLMIGGGGAGAGGSSFWGGGGGSAGDVLSAVVDVTPGDQFDFDTYYQHNPSASSGNPPSQQPTPADGFYKYEGKSVRLTRNADGKQIVAGGGLNGIHDSGGNGSGGAAPSSGTFIDSGITVQESATLRGSAGENANGTRGGVGGASFGFTATPPAHFLGGTFNGNPLENIGGGGGSSIGAPADTAGGSTSGVRCYVALIA